MKRSQVWKYWAAYSALIMMCLHVLKVRGWAFDADILLGAYACAGAFLVWFMTTGRWPRPDEDR